MRCVTRAATWPVCSLEAISIISPSAMPNSAASCTEIHARSKPYSREMAFIVATFWVIVCEWMPCLPPTR